MWYFWAKRTEVYRCQTKLKARGSTSNKRLKVWSHCAERNCSIAGFHSFLAPEEVKVRKNQTAVTNRLRITDARSESSAFCIQVVSCIVRFFWWGNGTSSAPASENRCLWWLKCGRVLRSQILWQATMQCNGFFFTFESLWVAPCLNAVWLSCLLFWVCRLVFNDCSRFPAVQDLCFCVTIQNLIQPNRDTEHLVQHLLEGSGGSAARQKITA